MVPKCWAGLPGNVFRQIHFASVLSIHTLVRHPVLPSVNGAGSSSAQAPFAWTLYPPLGATPWAPAVKPEIHGPVKSASPCTSEPCPYIWWPCAAPGLLRASFAGICGARAIGCLVLKLRLTISLLARLGAGQSLLQTALWAGPPSGGAMGGLVCWAGTGLSCPSPGFPLLAALASCTAHPWLSSGSSGWQLYNGLRILNESEEFRCQLLIKINKAVVYNLPTLAALSPPKYHAEVPEIRQTCTETALKGLGQYI